MIHNVLVSASTSGYYGDRVDEMLTDELGGSNSSGIRVVKFEDRHVLSSSGGMLSKILPLFKLGLDGRIGMVISI